MCAHVLRSLVVLPPKDLHAIGAESWHGTERRTHRAVSQADVATVVVQPQHLATRSGVRGHAARVAVRARAQLGARAEAVHQRLRLAEQRLHLARRQAAVPHIARAPRELNLFRIFRIK